MLDVGFRPMVWYALQTLEQGGVTHVFLVAAGREAPAFSEWVKSSYTGKCSVEVVAAADDADSADALREVADRLTAGQTRFYGDFPGTARSAATLSRVVNRRTPKHTLLLIATTTTRSPFLLRVYAVGDFAAGERESGV